MMMIQKATAALLLTILVSPTFGYLSSLSLSHNIPLRSSRSWTATGLAQQSMKLCVGSPFSLRDSKLTALKASVKERLTGDEEAYDERKFKMRKVRHAPIAMLGLSFVRGSRSRRQPLEIPHAVQAAHRKCALYLDLDDIATTPSRASNGRYSAGWV